MLDSIESARKYGALEFMNNDRRRQKGDSSESSRLSAGKTDGLPTRVLARSRLLAIDV